jgi:hypothetical protein
LVFYRGDGYPTFFEINIWRRGNATTNQQQQQISKTSLQQYVLARGWTGHGDWRDKDVDGEDVLENTY